ncbi:MAG: DUF2059 domain-containing protein [Alphaproteobacteria bacterium]
MKFIPFSRGFYAVALLLTLNLQPVQAEEKNKPSPPAASVAKAEPVIVQNAQPVDEATRLAAANLLDSMYPKETMERYLNSTREQQVRYFDNLPCIQYMRPDLINFMNSLMTYETVKDLSVAIYSENLSIDDIKKLEEFYKKPEGKKIADFLLFEGGKMTPAEFQLFFSDQNYKKETFSAEEKKVFNEFFSSEFGKKIIEKLLKMNDTARVKSTKLLQDHLPQLNGILLKHLNFDGTCKGATTKK